MQQLIQHQNFWIFSLIRHYNYNLAFYKSLFFLFDFVIKMFNFI